jgi:hypothetical protein
MGKAAMVPIIYRRVTVAHCQEGVFGLEPENNSLIWRLSGGGCKSEQEIGQVNNRRDNRENAARKSNKFKFVKCASDGLVPRWADMDLAASRWYRARELAFQARKGPARLHGE